VASVESAPLLAVPDVLLREVVDDELAGAATAPAAERSGSVTSMYWAP
jgi:hypothetical protein